MPAIYISGKLDFEIDIDKDYNNIYKSWTNNKLSAERKEYNHPLISLWFQLNNLEDPISPFTVIVSNLDMYEGSLTVEKSGRKFRFTFDGKAKTSAHKLTKDEIDKGRIPLLNSVIVNGEDMSIDERETTLVIGSKKPK